VTCFRSIKLLILIKLVTNFINLNNFIDLKHVTYF
jgi:hypothetical protein